ncbi:MAG TPA: DMT family transporter [Magnetospirillaceae bacterium]|nr:DMT family transporter [Magnetospirillaceae bacterium]
MHRIGELAAFGTAICWTVSAVFFEAASRRVGALAVNFYKLVGAIFFLSTLSWVLRGFPFPTNVPGAAWLWLSASGVVGFVVADIFLFNAYVMIGSRTTMLFLALSPPVTALFSFLATGEMMPPRGLAGMALVCAGITAAVLGRSRDSRAELSRERSLRRLGYLYAFLATVGQSAGMILTKLGAAGLDAVTATQIRVLAGMAGFALAAVVSGKGRAVFVEAPRNTEGMRSTAAGSFFGPFLGVTLSVFALNHTQAGAVSTLIGLAPVLIIAPSVLFLRQRVSLWEILGALAAVAGTMVFFL